VSDDFKLGCETCRRERPGRWIVIRWSNEVEYTKYWLCDECFEAIANFAYGRSWVKWVW
jgi:hypothetical protein